MSWLIWPRLPVGRWARAAVLAGLAAVWSPLFLIVAHVGPFFVFPVLAIVLGAWAWTVRVPVVDA
ncbi:hypothetical protein M3T53_05890 [Actinomyces sp. B33]|uniref:hypothetical protein n=1 Tax=Actinomyces sp. B33 TaxID=2942131 RepID=UPI0023408760|nr:hypothetical protein [Actinomyces sp. B33]MDC4233241.1 hypothetical protein [Actinomyces sp. B33]